MKVLVFVLVALVACAQSLTDEQKAEFQKHYVDCVKDTKVDEDLIKKMRAGTFAEAAELKEYVKCILIRMKIMSEAGEFLVEDIKKQIPSTVNHSNAIKVLESCSDNKTKDVAGRAFEVYKCWRSSNDNPIAF